MTAEQQKQIFRYLHTKNLPLDLLYEVQDHFIEQISELENKEELSFEQAFERVKWLWSADLKPSVRYPWWVRGTGVPTRLERRTYLRESSRLMRQSLLGIGLLFALTSLVVLFLPTLLHPVFMLMYGSVLLFLLIYLAIDGKSLWWGYRNKVKINLFQREISIFVIMGVLMLFNTNILSFGERVDKIALAIRHFFTGIWSFEMFISLAYGYFFVFAGLYGILILNRYARGTRELKIRGFFKN